MIIKHYKVLPTCFIHKWNEPYMPLLPSHPASLHFIWYSFPFALKVVSQSWPGWLVSGYILRWFAHLKMVTHPNANWSRRDAAKAITTTHNHQVSIGIRFVSLCYVCSSCSFRLLLIRLLHRNISWLHHKNLTRHRASRSTCWHFMFGTMLP